MAATWQVTGDLPNQYSTDTTGNPVLGHQISFTTGNGNSGTIFVPNTHYTPALVKPMLQLQANIVDEINSLTHES